MPKTKSIRRGIPNPFNPQDPDWQPTTTTMRASGNTPAVASGKDPRYNSRLKALSAGSQSRGRSRIKRRATS